MRLTVVLCCFLPGCVGLHAQAPTMLDNFNYRASWGDLGPIAPAPIEKLRALRIEKGSEALLASCLADTEKWRRDPPVSRFGHGHPFTTIGCRERSSPSLHVVFYKQPDGSRQAWIHFDRFSPGNLAGHGAEVAQNRLTFGRTSQADIYRSLVLRRADPAKPIPPPRYDLRKHTEEYLKSTLGVGSLAAVVVVGGESALLDGTAQFGHGFENYSNHMEANLVRHVSERTLEFGLAAALQQDETFAVSGDGRLRARIKAALYHSFFVPGRNGDEFAFPRLAAAIGTAWITHEWHPWQSARTDPWRDGAQLLSAYVARSFWHEFRPDIKNGLRAERRKLLKQGAEEPMIAMSSPAACGANCK